MSRNASRYSLITFILLLSIGASIWNLHQHGGLFHSYALEDPDIAAWSVGDLDRIEAQSNASPSAHAIFASNKATATFCMTMKIAISEGWQPVVVNWARHPDTSFQIAKIAGWREYLSTSDIPDNDIIFLLDAFDMWLQVGPDEAAQRYLALESRYGRGPVLVSAEKNCWPFPADDKNCQRQPNSSLPEDTYRPKTGQNPETKPPRYLNSGTFVGRKREILYVLSRIQSRLEDGEQYFDDQHVAALIYLEEGDRMFRLDYEQDIVMTMHLAVHDMLWMPDRSVIRDGRIRGWNKYTGTQPVAIHWNGGAKGGPMEDTFRNIHPLYEVELADNEALTIQTGEMLSFNAICRDLKL